MVVQPAPTHEYTSVEAAATATTKRIPRGAIIAGTAGVFFVTG